MSSPPVESTTRKIKVERVIQEQKCEPFYINVEQYTKLSTLRNHLKAKKIKGKLFVNEQDHTGKAGNKLLELQTSCVEIKSTTTIASSSCKYVIKVQFKGERKPRDLKCYPDTTAKDLKYFIQDAVGIPACELQLFISRKGEEKRVSPSQLVLELGKLVVKHHPKTFDSVPEDSLTTQAILYVSKVLMKWRELAEKGLGIGKSDIEAILNDFKNDMKEQRYQALLKWHQTNGNKATWRELIRCCYLIKNDELAKKIIKVYEEGKWRPKPDSPSPVQPSPEPQIDVDAMTAQLNNIGKLSEMTISHDPKRVPS